MEKHTIYTSQMDRPIDPAVRRQQTRKRILGISLVSLTVLIILFWGLNYLRPSVSRERVSIATVERGAVYETISASGTIVPETEYVISSPVSTTIQDILKEPGDILAPGDSLFLFDLTSQNLALEKIDEQMSLLENQREQVEVDLEIRLSELESQKRLHELRYNMTQSQHELLQEVSVLGGISKREMAESELLLETARTELERTERTIKNESILARNRLERILLEQSINQKERQEIVRTIERARTIVEHGGVLMWIGGEHGGRVSSGEVIARIADLDSYCVQASISEIHATKLTPGQAALVRLGDGTQLNGSIRNIQPTVESGSISFTVALNDSNDGHLRSNMRAQLELVTAYKPNALRIENGQFAQGYGISDVFVVEGNHALRREVTFGIAGFDWLEIIEGLSEGEKIIITDMSDRLYAKKIRLK